MTKTSEYVAQIWKYTTALGLASAFQPVGLEISPIPCVLLFFMAVSHHCGHLQPKPAKKAMPMGNLSPPRDTRVAMPGDRGLQHPSQASTSHTHRVRGCSCSHPLVLGTPPANREAAQARGRGPAIDTSHALSQAGRQPTANAGSRGHIISELLPTADVRTDTVIFL